MSNLVNFSELVFWFFFITTMGYLHEAHDGEANKTAYQKAKYKLQHNDSLLIAFHDETHKNDKIRTLA